ncbi:aminotransferase class V-fold PLP-dependent enzyme [Parapedobacter sp. ISTM3]|nr:MULTISPECIES: aminotransferase class V-fold PLP-dependent enzyme [Parapedobacter]MBK1440576.1 aminotransferase class V-fold PLP-dependent enzyme [Parapedobacter sp. ISTM3]
MDSTWFPVLQHWTYLNTASSGILAQPVLAWRRQHDEAFADEGSQFRIAHEPLLQTTRQAVADFFNGSTDRTVLLPNFSYGFNTLLSYFPKNYRYLLLADDYPSINYNIERLGLPRNYVPTDEHLETHVAAGVQEHQPDVFAFSLVQYISGIRINFDFLKDLKRQYPKLLVIADGTQYCGTEPFDFSASGIDILLVSGYKWMLAGYGNGFMMVKEDIPELLRPAGKDAPKPRLHHLLGKNDLSFAFEPGHQDTLAVGTLLQAINLFQTIAFPAEASRLRTLVTTAHEAFAERKLLDEPVVKRASFSHGTFFNLKGDQRLFDKLIEAKISCAMRGPGIRVGFHLFNTPTDLQRLLDVLDG